MTKDDFDKFARIWARAYRSASRGKDAAADQIGFAFDVLSIYSIEQVANALIAHARSGSRSDAYGLIPQDIVRHIDGEQPTVDQIIGAALKPRTALAVLCRLEIGTWDLNNWSAYQLKPMAEHCISMIPEWRDRIAAGELTAHELERMEHYGVDPTITKLIAMPGTRQAQLTEGGAS